MSLQSASLPVPDLRAPTLDYAIPADSAKIRGGDILACGFAITLAAWVTAYLCRMPLIAVSGRATVLSMLGVVFLGGLLTARFSPRGILASALAGGLSGILDILILGSLLKDAASAHPGVPADAFWIGGSILFNTLLATAGGVAGLLLPLRRPRPIRWPAVFALVLAAATLPLLTIGGLVTAFHSGLAVPDWPESYGYNMFLFPLSQMQANHGNFYEHAHRLMGSLVGFTALTLAIYLTVAERRRWIKLMAWGIGVGVAIQAVAGGLRVTEHSIALAIAHGIFAQIVFAAMACLAAMSSRAFLARPSERGANSSIGTDRALASALLAALLVQLMLGALVRHTDSMVLMHIVMAAVVATLALACGFRAWGLHGRQKPVLRAGIAVIALVGLQLVLGILALVWRSGPNKDPTIPSALLTTAHQANGALLLAMSAVLCVWMWRLVPQEAPAVPSASPEIAPASGSASQPV